MQDDHTTDDATQALLSRMRAVLPKTICTPAVLEAFSVSPYATPVERSEAFGAVAACLLMSARDIASVDFAAACVEYADKHASSVGQLLTADGMAPELAQPQAEVARVACEAGFIRRLQRALAELAAGRSFADQGIHVEGGYG